MNQNEKELDMTNTEIVLGCSLWAISGIVICTVFWVKRFGVLEMQDFLILLVIGSIGGPLWALQMLIEKLWHKNKTIYKRKKSV